MTSESIFSSLRKSANMTQDQFAETFGVSRQAVQKWESGASLPDIEKMKAIAKRFNITIDTIIYGKNREEHCTERDFIPDFSSLSEWESYQELLDIEYTQCLEEGRDILKYADLMKAVSAMNPSKEKAALSNIIFSLTQQAPVSDEFLYNEPSSLEKIRLLCARDLSQIPSVADKTDLRRKIKGAWLGRICGCLAGKCVEGFKTDELISMLKRSGNYPMQRYVKSTDISPEEYERHGFKNRPNCFYDNINVAPVDDDTNYTVLASELIKSKGRSFSPRDVAAFWIERQSRNSYCTAERIAFRNFINGYMPPDSASYKNPCREWIGAQIRGDYFGYINPGDPQNASDMAWRDASISHVKNGIYGEMFVAASIAGAAVYDDIKDVIRCGLSQIPSTSRLYARLNEILCAYENGMSVDERFTDIANRYDNYKMHDWCHTISNAEIVVSSLLYGGGDYGKTVCLAVQQGFDTDCNGATAGSILGMLKGCDAIPDVWTKPIGGKLKTTIFGVDIVDIESIVELTLSHIENK
ncbi:MAG: ADP-ribosylglycohydrolase family protein [Oscillospiraceae bacterium]|nr:ADP-ribosylglycohydrolase family protein [Oscillospiraceae bacterium]